ncbi:VOC family protein [Pseudogemmobacter sonorensis]|uniref:VOC family protein n=1 Tax=Pseudogemmobacter sonorensis TaxID=2989681 RepID=UPI0036BE1083
MTLSSLGLDHALVCVRDLPAARETYMALGFLSRGLSQHPWGTSTMVLIFAGQLFEVVSIGDPALLDGHEAGGFRFGRHVEAHLAAREGVCLTALNSEDAEADAQALRARGVAVTGTVHFGRDVTRGDGTPDRTRTRLEILANADFPRLSLFACQQFRRDLIEYPDWMDHPNGVTGIAGLTVVAGAEAPGVVDWFSRVHDQTPAPGAHVTEIATARGRWRVTDAAGFEALYGRAADWADAAPSVMAIDLQTRTPQEVAARAAATGLAHHWRDGFLVLPGPERLGGVILRFGDFEGAGA